MNKVKSYQSVFEWNLEIIRIICDKVSGAKGEVKEAGEGILKAFSSVSVYALHTPGEKVLKATEDDYKQQSQGNAPDIRVSGDF